MNEKLTQRTEVSYVDTQTGEIVATETSKTYTKRIKSDKFYMTFIDYVAPLYNLKSDSAKSILTYMCEIAEYNTGKVALTTGVRQELCYTLGISSNTLTNNLKKLKDLNLIDGEKGDFTINPQIFWKGDTTTRDQILSKEEIKITFQIQ